MAVGIPARPAAVGVGSVAECIVRRAWAGSAPPSAVMLTLARTQKGCCVA